MQGQHQGGGGEGSGLVDHDPDVGLGVQVGGRAEQRRDAAEAALGPAEAAKWSGPVHQRDQFAVVAAGGGPKGAALVVDPYDFIAVALPAVATGDDCEQQRGAADRGLVEAGAIGLGAGRVAADHHEFPGLQIAGGGRQPSRVEAAVQHLVGDRVRQEGPYGSAAGHDLEEAGIGLRHGWSPVRSPAPELPS